MASKRRIRRKECEGKERFSTQVDADTQSSFVYRVSGKRLHSYRCHFCQEFHLGHMPAMVQSAINFRRSYA